MATKSEKPQCLSTIELASPLGFEVDQTETQSPGNGPLIVVTGINVTAALALEEVHISLFAFSDGRPELQFVATMLTGIWIDRRTMHR